MQVGYPQSNAPPVDPVVRSVVASLWQPSAAGYQAPRIVTSWRPPTDGSPVLTQGFDVIRWMEACLVHTEGEWRGQPFRLLPWEKRLLLELFTLEVDPEWVAVPGQPLLFRRGLRRRYREAFITVPKKNGKTELAAAIALYLLIGDEEPSPKGVFAAGALHQAGLSFRAAQTMITASPVLRLLASERDVGDLVIEIPSIAGSRLERVAAEAGTNDGPSLHFGVLDEVHEWRGEAGVRVHGVITNAGAARRNSLFVSISTVGADDEDDTQVWVQLWQRGWQAVADPTTAPRFYFLCAAAPATEHWQDRAAWEQANPSAGVTVSWSFYEQQWTKGEAWCRRYYLNTPPGRVEDAWMDPDTWDARTGDVTIDPALPAYAAVRVDHDHGAAAVAIAQRRDGVVYLRTRTWLEADGVLVDADELEGHVLSLHRRYPARVLAALPARPGLRGPQVRLAPAPGPEVSYHGSFFESSAQRLRREGVVMVDIPHSQERLGPAAETLLQLAGAGGLVHNGDDDLARHVGAVVAKQADRGWRIVAPPGGRRRITAALAAMLAVHRAVTAQAAPSRAMRPPRSAR